MRSDLALDLVTGGFLILPFLLTYRPWHDSKTVPTMPEPTRCKMEQNRVCPRRYQR
jgi:hypothetical protein